MAGLRPPRCGPISTRLQRVVAGSLATRNASGTKKQDLGVLSEGQLCSCIQYRLQLSGHRDREFVVEMGMSTWTSYPHSGACLIPLAEVVYDVTLLFQAQGVMNCLVMHLHYVNSFYFSHTIQPALAYPSYGACCSGLTRVAGPGRAGSARSCTAECTPYNAATHYCCFINTDRVLEACLVGARHLVRGKCLRLGIGLLGQLSQYLLHFRSSVAAFEP